MRYHALSFVTVVFESEDLLLRLQARSIARYLPETLVAEIVVIDNSVRGMSSRSKTQLLRAYGPFVLKVRILRPEDICDIPRTLGWVSQQILKMAVAELISSPAYIVLDAKNLFVNPPDIGYFQTADGRGRVTAYSYEKHPLRQQLESVLGYCGVDPVDHIHHFTATVTPFILDTNRVRSLISDIEGTSGTSFAREFVAKGLLEFFLYSGWVLRNGEQLEDVFDLHQVSSPNVWPKSGNQVTVAAAIEESMETSAPLFSVHRRALARLDRKSLKLIATFWKNKELFKTESQATRFLRRYRWTFRREESIRRIREIAHARRHSTVSIVRRSVGSLLKSRSSNSSGR